MSKKVVINGANGRLGCIATKVIENSPEFELVAKSGRNDDLLNIIQKNHADIVIDVTTAESVYKNSVTIIESGAHPVIGASGLTLSQIKHLSQLCEEKALGGIIAPNFSFAAVLMMQFAQKAAKYLPDVEIIETHHTKKIDAPSGTALKTAEMISLAKADKTTINQDQDPSRGRVHQGIPIHALRLPGFIASQKVIFGSLGENLIIENNCIDRQAFEKGIYFCTKQVSTLSKMIYGLENLID